MSRKLETNQPLREAAGGGRPLTSLPSEVLFFRLPLSPNYMT